MRRGGVGITVVLTFLLGTILGVALAKREEVPSSAYAGKSPTEAAASLLTIAEAQAGDGTWERIHVARVYVLGGMQEEGQAILDSVLASPKLEAADWIRLGRVYAESGNWDKAREAFDSVLELAPRDEDWLAEIGAYYNLNGDRGRAEDLFERSFAEKPLLKNILAAAGSYVGVEPRRR